jgi:hypothetical protein
VLEDASDTRPPALGQSRDLLYRLGIGHGPTLEARGAVAERRLHRQKAVALAAMLPHQDLGLLGWRLLHQHRPGMDRLLAGGTAARRQRAAHPRLLDALPMNAKRQLKELASADNER